MSIRIGCGSWADAEYKGLLYPNGFPPDLRLAAYAMWFDHVEVNSSYYAIPRKEIVEKWVEQTPSSFLFDIRLPRSISQSPEKAGRDGKVLKSLLTGLRPLQKSKKMGVLLLVLSPFFNPQRHSLQELNPLIERLEEYSLAVELRHSDWISPERKKATLDFFRNKKLTWVSVDMPRIEGSVLMPPLDEVTQPALAYLRLHGRNPHYLKLKSAAERHTYAYSPSELIEIAQRIRKISKEAKNVRVVANNHAFDFAPRTALALQELMEQ